MPRQIAAVIAAGLLYGLSFPPYGLSFLAWFALVPLLWISSGDDLSPRSVFGAGFLSGLTANLVIFSWLWPTFIAAHINLATTFLCWLLLSALLALYVGGFAFVHRWMGPGIGRVWTGAALWVVLDEVRTVILSGFPWALLSHTQTDHASLIQLASVTGAPGITFLIVAVNLAIVETVISARRTIRSGWINLAAALLLPIALTVMGAVRLHAAQELLMRSLTVAVLQGNIDQYQKWDEKYEEGIRETYADLAARAGSVEPDVIIWPETSVPAWIPSETPYVKWIQTLAMQTFTPHLFGSLSQLEGKEYNSAFLMDEDGRLEGVYNKQHLVPFGEYVPAGGFLKKLIPYLGQVGTFDAGKGPYVFDIDGILLSPNICYEAMFPALVRRSVQKADVIVNLTNDGWFLDSGAPHQHWVVNILRAVENGRPVIRAANSGISGFIDPYGRVRAKSPLMVADGYLDTIPVPPADFRTFYGNYGNWFGWLCFVLCASWGIFLTAQRRRAISI